MSGPMKCLITPVLGVPAVGIPLGLTVLWYQHRHPELWTKRQKPL